MITKFAGILLFAAALGAVYVFETSGALSGAFRLFHWPAIFLTAVGPVGIVLFCSEWSHLKEIFRLVRARGPHEMERDLRADAHVMQKTVHRAPRPGAAPERAAPKEGSPALRRVFRRLSARVPLEDVRDLVERERDRAQGDLERGLKLVSLGLRMSPSVGMLGTILGMVQLLSHLQDPGSIGAHMSLALLTTFYGLFFSLVVWTPLQNRMETLLDLTDRSYGHILHWLQLLAERKPLRYLDEPASGFGNSAEAEPENPAGPRPGRTAPTSPEGRA